MPALIRKILAAKERKLGSVQIWGDGTPLREFLHVDDLAAGVVHCHDHYSEFEHINCGSEQEVTIRRLAEIIADIVGYEGRFEFDATKPNGTPRKVMDSSRLRAMGWEPKISLADGIRSTIDWFVKTCPQG